jgi:hypothetical protein
MGMGLRILPCTDPGQGESGTAVDFEAGRVAFEAAWQRLLPALTEASFQEWRDQRDWTARKYAMRQRGELMPTQKPNSIRKPRQRGGVKSHCLVAWHRVSRN